MIFKWQEKVAKGRGIIKEVNESFKAVNLEETTKQLVQVLPIILRWCDWWCTLRVACQCGFEKCRKWRTVDNTYYSSFDPKSKLFRNNSLCSKTAQENEFRTGLSSNLVPWIDRFNILKSPRYAMIDLICNDMQLYATRSLGGPPGPNF